jgi:hypothetical protein
LDAHQTRSYDRLARVREFGRQHPAAFPPESDAATLLARLGALVDTLSGYSVTKTTGDGVARQGSANRRLARATLRDDLEAISRTARAISIRIPNVEQKFRLPAASRDQAIVDAAKSFAAEAAPLKAEFARLALGDDFFAKLATDIAAFEQALSSQQGGRQTRVAAAGAIDNTLAEGSRVVRQIDAYVQNRFADEPLVLAAWRDASRLRRASRRRAKEQPDNGAMAPVTATSDPSGKTAAQPPDAPAREGGVRS